MAKENTDTVRAMSLTEQFQIAEWKTCLREAIAYLRFRKWILWGLGILITLNFIIQFLVFRLAAFRWNTIPHDIEASRLTLSEVFQYGFSLQTAHDSAGSALGIMANWIAVNCAYIGVLAIPACVIWLYRTIPRQIGERPLWFRSISLLYFGVFPIAILLFTLSIIGETPSMGWTSLALFMLSGFLGNTILYTWLLVLLVYDVSGWQMNEPLDKQALFRKSEKIVLPVFLVTLVAIGLSTSDIFLMLGSMSSPEGDTSNFSLHKFVIENLPSLYLALDFLFYFVFDVIDFLKWNIKWIGNILSVMLFVMLFVLVFGQQRGRAAINITQSVIRTNSRAIVLYIVCLFLTSWTIAFMFQIIEYTIVPHNFVDWGGETGKSPTTDYYAISFHALVYLKSLSFSCVTLLAFITFTIACAKGLIRIPLSQSEPVAEE